MLTQGAKTAQAQNAGAVVLFSTAEPGVPLDSPGRVAPGRTREAGGGEPSRWQPEPRVIFLFTSDGRWFIRHFTRKHQT